MVVGSLDIETDVLVIGSGPGGYVAAIRAAQLGKDVMIIEKEKKLGGVCLNTGCIPTKALIHASNFFHTIHDLGNMGINIKDYSIDITKMHGWKDSILQRLESGIRDLCKHYDIEIIEGKAVFKSDYEIHVEGKTDISSIKFKNCIIATGSSSIEIPTLKFDGQYILSSTEALELHDIPKKLIVIGGGYIGTELGTVFGKLGSEVHIIESESRLLSVLEEDIVDVVYKKLKQFNIQAHFNTKALDARIKDGRVTVRLSEGSREYEIDADKIFVVVGRKPNSKDLGLENTHVKTNEKGFIVADKQMRTNAPNIFAIGDVIGQPMLAHKATREAKIASEVICGMNSIFDNKVIPFVVFNDPEIASVGLTEDQAKQQGYDIIIGKFPFSALGRAMTLNETDGFAKYVAEKGTGLILGVHAVGPNASDMISEATLAIEMGATLEDVADTIHPHPTLPESLMEAAEVTLGKGIHIYQLGNGK